MNKYFWFITIPPKVGGTAYDDNTLRLQFTKRSITPPLNNKTHYIIEKIDGYNHTITDSKKLYPTLFENDLGKPHTIHEISESIKIRLREEWKKDSASLENQRNLSTPIYETDDEGETDIGGLNFTRHIGIPLSFSRKKSLAIKKAKRIIPCKCKKNIRKVKK